MKKAMSALGILLLLVYIGYQISHNLTDQIETIDAQMVAVEDKTTCEGIFIRSSIPVYGDTDKTYEFLAGNGEKVSKGQKIAAVFDSLEAAASFRKASSLEK
ncbi:MAG: hypothetical protein VB078_09740, partial [Clostridiaceae bacterium]|nr:hypothetical protein [Clostridiaceae bacterium]